MIETVDYIGVNNFQSLASINSKFLGVQMFSSSVKSGDSGLERSPNSGEGNCRIDSENPELRHRYDNKSEKLTEAVRTPYNADKCSISNSRFSVVPTTEYVETVQLHKPHGIFYHNNNLTPEPQSIKILREINTRENKRTKENLLSR